MTTGAQVRQRTLGTVEERSGIWWNRFREEVLDSATGLITRRQQRMRLGEFRSKAAAEAALERYLSLLSPETLAPGADVTVQGYCARFDRVRISLMRPESQRGYRGVIKRYVLPKMAKQPLASIDGSALQELVATLHARGLARATVKSVRDRILEILKHARASGYAAHAISRAMVRLPSESRVANESRHFTRAEVSAILTAESGARRALWAILAFGGLRIAEGLGLQWKHVDLGAGLLRIRQACVGGRIAPLKTAHSMRDVPILEDLKGPLLQFQGDTARDAEELIFQTARGTPYRADDIRRRWLRPLLARLGLKAAGAHAFRHFTPGYLDAMGLTPEGIRQFMGHTNLSMTQRYLHLGTRDLQEQIAAALGRDERRPQAAP
jgi:integrase